MKKKIGLVLSGGGARGFAHLGVMKALYEKEIYPDEISGVSAGALTGVFLANDAEPEEIFKFFRDKSIMKTSKLKIPKNGLLNLEGIKRELQDRIRVEDIRDLKKPFFVAVSNMSKGRVEYLDSGPLLDIILASSSIPVLFSPINMKGDYYSDGGLFDNLPVKPLRDRCDVIIGVHVNPVNSVEKLDSLVRMASRTFHLTVNNTVMNSKNLCDVWIEPESLDQYEILDFKKAEKIYQTGYDFAKKMEISF